MIGLEIKGQTRRKHKMPELEHVLIRRRQQLGVYRCISYSTQAPILADSSCKGRRTWCATLVQITGGCYTLWNVQDNGIIVLRSGRRSVQ